MCPGFCVFPLEGDEPSSLSRDARGNIFCPAAADGPYPTPISPSIDDVSGRRRGRLIARIAASQMDAVVGGREIKGGKKVSVLPAGLC